MNQWAIYFYERLSPLTLLFVIMGISVSGSILGDRGFSLFSFTSSSLLLFYIAFLLRLKNDLGDLDTDRVAYPKRALSRGLLHPKEVQMTVSVSQYGLAVYFVSLFLIFENASRVMLLLTVCYLWLMYKNFYLGESLDRKPLWKTVLQQGLIIPLTFLVISFNDSEQIRSLSAFSYVLLLYGSFFTFDICRKLDPRLHPASQSLIHFFGFKKVYRVAVICLILSALGSYGLGIARYLIPCEIMVFIALTYLFKNPRQFSIAETAASLSLIVHSWAILFTII